MLVVYMLPLQHSSFIHQLCVQGEHLRRHADYSQSAEARQVAEANSSHDGDGSETDGRERRVNDQSVLRRRQVSGMRIQCLWFVLVCFSVVYSVSQGNALL